MSSERELRDAAENLLDAAVQFNRTASDVLAHSAWRVKGEPWRRRADQFRCRAAQAVELTLCLARQAESIESYIFADDGERIHRDRGAEEPLPLMRAWPKSQPISPPVEEESA
jgi:hypothetical protein